MFELHNQYAGCSLFDIILQSQRILMRSFDFPETCVTACRPVLLVVDVQPLM